MQFLVDKEVMLMILDYLSNRPYKEVSELIQKLVASKPVKEENKDANNS